MKKINSHLLGSFVVTVLMVTFSWIGLADYKWHAPSDSLDLLKTDFIENESLPMSLMPEIKQLERTTRFESMRVGVSGRISSNYTAFNKIKNSENAEFIFNYLMAQENAVAKLYGMKGFEAIESPFFEKFKNYFENSEKIIEVQSGCSVYYEDMSVFYKQTINVYE